jgi:hypothetical protein
MIVMAKKVEYNPILRREIIGVVENQINENNPKETKITFNRLIKSGYSEDEAYDKIGAIVIEEIFDVLKKQEPYNEERYVSKLKAIE